MREGFWPHEAKQSNLALQSYGQKNAGPAIAASSTLVLVSLLLFAVNLFLNGRLDHPSRC